MRKASPIFQIKPNYQILEELDKWDEVDGWDGGVRLALRNEGYVHQRELF
jgi:hypothetical protein